jgi:hypothetical protein
VEKVCFVADDPASHVNIEVFERRREQVGAMKRAEGFDGWLEWPRVANAVEICRHVHADLDPLEGRVTLPLHR